MDTLLDSPLTIIAAVVLGLTVLTVISQLVRRKLSVSAYRREDHLFTPAERSFLQTLDAAVAPGHRVFGKVRVADIVGLKQGLSAQARQAALNRVAQKHFDFVVCDADSLSPECAVELNDSSHGSKRARARDEFLGSVCKAVGLPLVTIRAAASYSVEEIRAQVFAAIGSNNNRGALSGRGDR